MDNDLNFSGTMRRSRAGGAMLALVGIGGAGSQAPRIGQKGGCEGIAGTVAPLETACAVGPAAVRGRSQRRPKAYATRPGCYSRARRDLATYA